MGELYEIRKRLEPATCTISGNYTNTTLTGTKEKTDHDPATKTAEVMTYTQLERNRESSDYENLQIEAHDQPETSVDGVLAIMNKKQLKIFFSVLLVLIIILVITLCILVPLLVYGILSKESRLDALEVLFQSEKDTVDDLKGRTTFLESNLSSVHASLEGYLMTNQGIRTNETTKN